MNEAQKRSKTKIEDWVLCPNFGQNKSLPTKSLLRMDNNSTDTV